MKRLQASALGTLALLMAGCGPVLAASANPLADNVRAANDRFRDVAAAVAEGYAPIPCASGVAGGAMGIHYVNPAYVGDEVIDIAKPEAVMYEPSADGKMTLIAVEYITTKGPAELQGHLFNFCRRAEPLRPARLLRAACLGVEAEPRRHLRRHEPARVLRRRHARKPRPLSARNPIQHPAARPDQGEFPCPVCHRTNRSRRQEPHSGGTAGHRRAVQCGDRRARRALRVDRQLRCRRQALLHS